jgi:hypothetical protein
MLPQRGQTPPYRGLFDAALRAILRTMRTSFPSTLTIALFGR